MDPPHILFLPRVPPTGGGRGPEWNYIGLRIRPWRVGKFYLARNFKRNSPINGTEESSRVRATKLGATKPIDPARSGSLHRTAPPATGSSVRIIQRKKKKTVILPYTAQAFSKNNRRWQRSGLFLFPLQPVGSAVSSTSLVCKYGTESASRQLLWRKV